MYDLIVEGGTFLPMVSDGDRLEDGRLLVQNGKIVSLTKRTGPPPPAKKTLIAQHCLVLPGLINAHTHVGMSLFRGLADDVGFETWLKEIVFPLEKQWVSADTVHLAGLLACLEMIRSGTVCFNDMYYLQEHTARAVDQAGLRAILGVTFIEEHLDPKKDSIADTMARFASHLSPFPRIAPALAPHSLYSLEPQRLVEITEVAEHQKMRVNIHLSETEAEVQECLKKTGQTPVAYLETLGFWDLPVTAAHAVVLNENDLQILGKHRVGISHNPESNLKLGNLIAPVAELIEAGARVGLGTDSVVSNNNLDMLEEAATASRLQSVKYGPGRLVAEDFVKLLTSSGAAAVGLESVTGKLSPGMSADFITIDLRRPHLQPLHDPYSQVIYSAGGSDVRDVVVDGNLLMEEGRVLTIDEEALLKEVIAVGKKIGQSLPPRRPRPQKHDAPHSRRATNLS